MRGTKANQRAMECVLFLQAARDSAKRFLAGYRPDCWPDMEEAMRAAAYNTNEAASVIGSLTYGHLSGTVTLEVHQDEPIYTT